MNNLKNYLLKKYTPATTRMYLRDIRLFLDYMGEEKAEAALYNDIMQYVEYLRRQQLNPSSINRMLYGVRAWYDWLLKTGRRNDHPCRYLVLKDVKGADIQLQDLFTPSELELLMDRKERFESLRVRNQVIISLLIYQGLRLKEIPSLKIIDVDLEKAVIHIRGMISTLPRTLQMKPTQVMIFYRYIQEIRPKVVNVPVDILLLNIRGKPITADDINYLLESFKTRFPGRVLSAKTIRQSVIANLLKTGKDLRMVQAFAGHKKVSSTERYRQTGLEALKAAIQKYHPLSGDH